jgi:lipoyl(octanoyl) transferase
MKGRLLIHPAGEGLWNMAVDAVLARRGRAALTLRCYGWSPATCSLGHAQKWNAGLEARSRAAGLPVVRRETGGRAVLHADELTYCVTVPASSPLHEGNLQRAYGRINRALAAGISRLGLAVQQESRRIDLAEAYRRELGGLCFAATAQSEVLWQGRKLVGSAQRQLREGLLQHGSLIIGLEHARIGELFFDDPELRARAREKLLQATTCLEEALGHRPAFEEIAAALVDGFEEEFDLSLEAEGLTPGEEALVASWAPAFDPRHEAVRLPDAALAADAR